jgi:hypothetical protein
MTRKELVDLVGLDCALRLCINFGGEHIKLPRWPLSAVERARDHDDGSPAHIVADRAGVAVRTVYRARSRE